MNRTDDTWYPRKTAHIDRKLSSQPFQLRRIRDQSTDAADMWFGDMSCFGSKSVDDHQVIREHIRALVIFRRNVLRDRIRQRHRVRAAERKL